MNQQQFDHDMDEPLRCDMMRQRYEWQYDQELDFRGNPIRKLFDNPKAQSERSFLNDEA